MPIAAVPWYLTRYLDEKGFRAASPALRFGLLLPVWTSREDQEAEVRQRAAARSKEGQELATILQRQGMDAAIRTLRGRDRLPGLLEKNDFAARQAWNKVAALNPGDKARMQALLERQKSLSKTIEPERVLVLEAEATAPFTTGLGNEHPLENGFAFLNPYGLPYLPASGVKGVLRQAARELAGGKWGDTRGWSEQARYTLGQTERTDQPPVKLSMLDVLFGRETEEGEEEHYRGTLAFWDVIPQIPGDRLMVEIMTPHYAHYYAPGNRPEDRVVSPHDSGQPNPISFLTVPPGAKFVFFVTCDTERLKNIAPDLAENGRWRQLLEAAFEHAFRWLGFGAKTAVGYGAMRKNRAGARRRNRGATAGPQRPQTEGQPRAPQSAAPSVSATQATVWKERHAQIQSWRSQHRSGLGYSEKRAAARPGRREVPPTTGCGQSRATQGAARRWGTWTWKSRRLAT